MISKKYFKLILNIAKVCKLYINQRIGKKLGNDYLLKPSFHGTILKQNSICPLVIKKVTPAGLAMLDKFQKKTGNSKCFASMNI